MLHGWGNDVSSFWETAENLKDHFTIYLIDLPGFGRSDTPRSFTVEDYAQVIKEFIEKFNLTKLNILGHSLGGRISIKLLSKYPQIADKLILESSAGIKPKQDYIKPFLYILAKFFKYFIPNLFNIKQTIRFRIYKNLEADYIHAGKMKQTLTNILDEDLSPDITKIKNDTLLIWGDKDQAVPTKYGRQMYQLIPKSRIEIFENTGHFPHIENKDLFLYLVKDFLT